MGFQNINSSKRIAAMRDTASDLEMKFQEKDEWGLINLLEDFKLFKKGGRKKILNLMTKKAEFLEEQFHIFDYQYVISSGKSARRFNQTVYFIQSKHLGLPEFLMKPENFFHKIGSFLGMQDIDFIQNDKFSNQYLLKGADEALIRDMMNDEVLHYFTIRKDWHLEGVGYFLILYQNNVLFDPRVIKKFYYQGMELYHLLKQEIR